MALFPNRKTFQLEDDYVRLSITAEGGHVAELFCKSTGVNPLWIPPWPSIEPSSYDAAKYPEYGADSESKLLAGIAGHNLALDIFGPPSAEEYAAGVTVHGESSVVRYDIEANGNQLTAEAHLPLAQLDVKRTIRLTGDGGVQFTESVANLLSIDRPIAWQQHVTLGDPFVQRGVTRLDMPVSQSMVFPEDFGTAEAMQPGATFTWPHVPAKRGGTLEMSRYPSNGPTSALTGHLLHANRETAYFQAWNADLRTVIGYAWQRSDYPWICLWEENRGRTIPPWNGRTTTWGVEFGASPFAESRRAMIERGTLFGAPTYRWLPARAEVVVHYTGWVRHCESESEFAAGPRFPAQL
jgi:hypothetical protein